MTPSGETSTLVNEHAPVLRFASKEMLPSALSLITLQYCWNQTGATAVYCARTLCRRATVSSTTAKEIATREYSGRTTKLRIILVHADTLEFPRQDFYLSLLYRFPTVVKIEKCAFGGQAPRSPSRPCCLLSAVKTIASLRPVHGKFGQRVCADAGGVEDDRAVRGIVGRKVEQIKAQD
jgi:hypothetical protein